MKQAIGFQVPWELEPFVDDHVLSVHERWQNSNMAQNMPGATTIDLDNGRRIRAAVLWPAEKHEAIDEVLVLSQSHAQAWKPSMYIRSEIARQVVSPNSPMVVFPNNSLKGHYYDLTDFEMAKISTGNLAPLAELQARALEKLQLGGKVALSGYSLGALIAPAIAAVGSDKFEVLAVNADEAPNKVRTPKKLRKDFLESGGWGEQRQAIADAAIPALDKALSRPKMAADYGAFALATVVNAENRVLGRAMTYLTLYENLQKARANYPELTAKVGYVAKSLLFNTGDIDIQPGVRQRCYRGEATYGHSTVDNIMAHALMVKDGLTGRLKA